MNNLEGLKKVDALKRLKKKVLKYGVIGYQYVGKNPDGKRCHCAVGHLMNLCGVDMDKISMTCNSEIISMVSQESVGGNIIAPLLEVGFTVSELNKLQTVNDNGTKFSRKKDVIDCIDDMIELELGYND